MSTENATWTHDTAGPEVGCDGLDWAVWDTDGDLRARFLVRHDAAAFAGTKEPESKYSEYEREHPETVPELYVEKAAKRTAEAVAELLTIANLTEGEQVLEEMGAERIAKALDTNTEEVDDLATDELRERADEYMASWPLCIEASTTFEIVLGTGGPDSRLMIECSREDGHQPRQYGEDPTPTTYEIRRVFYRYSWSGSADFELRGDDREAAEAFARRVVPELADA